MAFSFFGIGLASAAPTLTTYFASRAGHTFFLMRSNCAGSSLLMMTTPCSFNLAIAAALSFRTTFWLDVCISLLACSILFCISGVNFFQLLRLTTIRSEEHTSELQSLMRISYAVFCLKNKKQDTKQ